MQCCLRGSTSTCERTERAKQKGEMKDQRDSSATSCENDLTHVDKIKTWLCCVFPSLIMTKGTKIKTEISTPPQMTPEGICSGFTPMTLCCVFKKYNPGSSDWNDTVQARPVTSGKAGCIRLQVFHHNSPLKNSRVSVHWHIRAHSFH